MLVFLFTTTIAPFLCLFYHNIAKEDDVLSSIVIIMGETISFGTWLSPQTPALEDNTSSSSAMF